eukprot:TRINITY_DN7069_c0_g1_i1.p1 TRINITY_DN7069_c0_g1~~TRINITY_DN7069_c0_g1_i1.p1  ORF type:complete len:489 (+),score=88.77 TRINITY_DN7069_c0_g1_i1:74-1540(+)
MAAPPLRGRAAAEAAAKAKAEAAAKDALEKRDELLKEQQEIGGGVGRPPPASLPPTSLPSTVADGGIHRPPPASLSPANLPAAGGLPSTVPDGGKRGLPPENPYRPVFPAIEVDSDEIRSMRREFEGAIAEYKVQAKAATDGLGSGGGAGLVKRFSELEAAWGEFQWNQRTNAKSISHGLRQTHEETLAMASAMSGSGFSRRGIDDEIEGLDLEHEVDSVLKDIWQTLEEEPLSLARRRRQKQVPIEAAESRTKSAIEATITDLDRLEANILKRIDDEERAEATRQGINNRLFGPQGGVGFRLPDVELLRGPVAKTAQTMGGVGPMQQEPTTVSLGWQQDGHGYLEHRTGRAIDEHDMRRQGGDGSGGSNWFGDLTTSVPSHSSQAILSRPQSPPHTHQQLHSSLQPPSYLTAGHLNTSSSHANTFPHTSPPAIPPSYLSPSHPSTIPMVNQSEIWSPPFEPVSGSSSEPRARPRPMGSNGCGSFAGT